MNSYTPSTKEEKVELGRKFISKLNKKSIRFAGITGSVSYNPGLYDDIDIFIISKRGFAWKAILDAMIIRRLYGMVDICISLVMDENFALSYFTNLNDKLIVKDSLNVIPVYGKEFYLKLLQCSPSIAALIGKSHVDARTEQTGRVLEPLNLAIFLGLSPLLIVKSIYNNWKEMKKNGGFDTHVSLDSFYLDSYKYRMLRKSFSGEEVSNGKILYNDSEL